MGVQIALDAFVEDLTNRAIFVLIALDFVLGVLAALKTKTFRMSYVADFFRNDVLGKVVPYFGLWWALHLSGDLNLGDLEVVEEVTGAAIVAALIASVLNSFKDMNTPVVRDFPEPIAGPDPGSPM